jgi:hypothetical protein
VSEHPQKVLTGDALFIGDVGRPDLVGSKGYTAEQMAGMLYDSLHEKLMKLDDEFKSIRRTARARCVDAISRRKLPRLSANRSASTTRSRRCPGMNLSE